MIESEDIYENSNAVKDLELEEDFYENNYELTHSSDNEYEITDEYAFQSMKHDRSPAQSIKTHQQSGQNRYASSESQNQYQSMNQLTNILVKASPKFNPRKGVYTVNEPRPTSRVPYQKQQVPSQNDDTLERRRTEEKISKTLGRTLEKRRADEDITTEKKVNGDDLDASKEDSVNDKDDDGQFMTDSIVYNKYESIRINDGLKLRPKYKKKTCFSCLSMMFMMMITLLLTSLLLISVLQYFLIREVTDDIRSIRAHQKNNTYFT